MPKDASILDEWFPRDEPVATVARPQLYSWRCEEGVARILNHFCDRTDYMQPKDPVTRRSWIAGARRWNQQFGEDMELMTRAISYMDKRNLTISSPHSLMNVGMALKRERTEEDTSKYLEWLK